MRHLTILTIAIALAGCGTTPAQQTAVSGAVATLASVAAAQNTTVAAIVTQGGLFCGKATAGSPLVVALANIYGAPVSVVNQTAANVATACALIGGIPVAPPADPASAVVVAAPVVALPAA